jgi:hypothetical protein
VDSLFFYQQESFQPLTSPHADGYTAAPRFAAIMTDEPQSALRAQLSVDLAPARLTKEQNRQAICTKEALRAKYDAEEHWDTFQK